MDLKITLKGMLSVLLAMLLCGPAWGQLQELSGKVTDENDKPLAGVAVQVVGTAQATSSRPDGSFRLMAEPSARQLEFTAIGYAKQIVDIAGRTAFTVKMNPETVGIDAVVVTALGITREQKSIGYAAQSVSGESISAVASISPLNALSGMIAGMSVNSSGAGAGGSVRMLIRGANSLSGSNEPLYVVDGVPIDNTFAQTGDSWGGIDYGNAANNINADDIETITVLKGGAAAALYGSRGQNGVVMITTKKAAKGETLAINLKQSVTFEKPMMYPSLQGDFSQGSNGAYVLGSYQSWGARMNGQNVTNFLNQTQQLNYNSQNPLKEFLSTGLTSNTSINISKGTRGGSIYASAAYLDSKGNTRTDEFNKLNLNLRVVQDLTPWLNMDVKANVLNQKGENRPRLFGAPDNPVYAFSYFPRSVMIDQIENYATLGGDPVYFTGRYNVVNGHPVLAAPLSYGTPPLLDNPYWAANLNKNKDTRNRFIGYSKFEIDMLKIFPSLGLDKFTAMGRAGIDFYTGTYYDIEHNKTLYKPSGLATIDESRDQVSESNFDALITAQKKICKFGISLMGGANLRNTRYQSMAATSSQGVIDPAGHYTINNFNGVKATDASSRKQMQSVYGNLTLDYASQVYLEASARNDWSSALAPENWSFFYPSVSASWILTETFPGLRGATDMLKLRGSYARVGSDIGAHQLNYLYVTLPGEYMNLPFGSLGMTNKPNYNILPESTISAEAGIEARFFKGRLTADLAYYQNGTRNQIFAAPVAPSSGFGKAMINSGYIKNKGFEASLKGAVIRNANLEWTFYGNFSTNNAKVEELSSLVDVLTIGGMAGVSIQARLGQAPGTLEGTAYARDAEGNFMLDSKNLPIKKLNDHGAVSTTEKLGYSLPKYMGGIGTTLSWKGLNADIFCDYSGGNDIFSQTNAMGNANGILDGTQGGRDEWSQALALANVIGGGYDPRNIGGLPVYGTKNGVTGTYYANPQEYYGRLSEINEAYMYDASYVRLQRISVGYTFTGKALASVGLHSVNVSVIGSNLFYIWKATKNITPKMSTTYNAYGGIEYYACPELRSLGASVSLTF